MEAPLVLTTEMSLAAQMVVAVIVGAGFGFILERAGFGRADVLASVFYGRDFRVMRVMFTAIVTAMVGLYVLDLVGIMPLGAIGLMPTFLLPQLVGGLLLGVGFITGGYCPGTSLVATASGKLDGLLFVGGIFIGGMLFTLSYGWLEGFHTSTSMGRVLLHEYLGISSGIMVFSVTLFAVAALWAVTRIEALVNRRVARRRLAAATAAEPRRAGESAASARALEEEPA